MNQLAIFVTFTFIDSKRLNIVGIIDSPENHKTVHKYKRSTTHNQKEGLYDWEVWKIGAKIINIQWYLLAVINHGNLDLLLMDEWKCRNWVHLNPSINSTTICILMFCSAKFQFVNQELRKIMFHHVIYQIVLGVWILSIMEFNHVWTRLHCCLVISLLCKVNSDENYMYISRTVVINTLQSICWLRPGSKNLKNITARSFKHDSHLPHQTNIGITYGGRYLSPLFSRWEKKHSMLGLYDIKNEITSNQREERINI